MPDHPGAATTGGDEVSPAEAGVDGELVERIWESGVSLYRSGVHPALQLCVRRDGHVIVDRAIGHARGNGPDDGDEVPKVAVTTETPFCVYSTSKGITAMV